MSVFCFGTKAKSKVKSKAKSKAKAKTRGIPWRYFALAPNRVSGVVGI